MYKAALIFFDCYQIKMKDFNLKNNKSFLNFEDKSILIKMKKNFNAHYIKDFLLVKNHSNLCIQIKF